MSVFCILSYVFSKSILQLLLLLLLLHPESFFVVVVAVIAVAAARVCHCFIYITACSFLHETFYTSKNAPLPLE